MSKIFKAGIFDAGGVLQTYEVMEPIFEDIVKTLKISRDDFDPIWNEYSHKLATNSVSEETFWHNLIKRTGTSELLPNQSLLLRKYAENFKINPDTLKIVKELKENGIKLAILTNSMKPHTQYNQKMGLYSYFDVRVMSDEVGMRKPDLNIYQLCLEKLGISAIECFMVDDKQRNLDPAEQLGITEILFESPEKLRTDLIRLGILT